MGVLEVLSDPSWDPVEDLRRSYEGSGAAEEEKIRNWLNANHDLTGF